MIRFNFAGGVSQQGNSQKRQFVSKDCRKERREVRFILLIYLIMLTIVAILTLMSKINFIGELSMKKSFIILGPVLVK